MRPRLTCLVVMHGPLPATHSSKKRPPVPSRTSGARARPVRERRSLLVERRGYAASHGTN